MISDRDLDRAHLFLWNYYGSKGVELCSVHLRVWIARACGLDPIKDKDAVVDAVNRLTKSGRITVYESRVEIHGPRGERYDWAKLIAANT